MAIIMTNKDDNNNDRNNDYDDSSNNDDTNNDRYDNFVPGSSSQLRDAHPMKLDGILGDS